MKITGKLIEKFDTIVVSEKFKKRDFVLHYAENPQYPETIKFELHQGKTDLIDAFNVNDRVSIEFNLKGKKWVNKEGKAIYFNTLVCWKITIADVMIPENITEPQNAEPQIGDGDGDLPF